MLWPQSSEGLRMLLEDKERIRAKKSVTEPLLSMGKSSLCAPSRDCLHLPKHQAEFGAWNWSSFKSPSTQTTLVLPLGPNPRKLILLTALRRKAWKCSLHWNVQQG